MVVQSILERINVGRLADIGWQLVPELLDAVVESLGCRWLGMGLEQLAWVARVALE